MMTSRTSGRRMSLNPLPRLFAGHYAEGVVEETVLETSSVRRIRIVSPTVKTLAYRPGQHVRIQINDPLSLYGLLRPGETLRSYTICNFSREEGAFELRIHLYPGEGIGLRWATSVSAGDPVVFWGPQGDFVTRPGPYHLFLGEESATLAFQPMIETLDDAAPVYALLESDHETDAIPIDGVSHLQRAFRCGASAVASQAMLDALSAMELPDRPGRAYIAGEARTCQLVRRHLINQRGWPRTAIKIKPFWAVGRRGLH
ncbi:MAG: siderophore-interacting protein [Ectothiorhodospiraceae bacterium]|nr:siderophore-interacting protein [Ectothiorhodospiraceae bacterium]